ncbi:tyrosine-type recombinase/integrase [Pelagibacterium flavum]|uniref:Tyrosine-type recombinase/integrase n=1 Tax=Pelagibacterium flavum TaxID=2984530 RepID=A0ABY6IJ91_9HYPH|nr:site-specific integrase [Pelagibacterium sp. YIM 151497]UYQ70667.1 tyrosine-type recombinase/integrase [Pelagibacterium sp. YIM 151497]
MGIHTRNVLTVKQIASSKGKKLRDGGGLWLVTKGTGRYWALDYRIGGRRRQLGLGPLHSVTLAEAREKAQAAREMVRQGVDPIEHRHGVEAIETARAQDEIVTFGKYADSYIDDAVKSGRWRGKKTEARWRNLLETHAAPIRGKALSAIGVTEVLTALRPLWGIKQETAEKLREAIERVLDSARVEGKREGDNPARWKGNLEHVLHKPDALSRTTHHAAMPHADVPVFMIKLQSVDGFAARALEFAILTAARSGEARGATWAEIDFDKKIWTVPAERMKSGKPHRVALSDKAIKLLRDMQDVQINHLIFPGAKSKRPLSDAALGKALNSAGGEAYTPHGFRSTFRDWATDVAHAPREIAEAALSHAVGDSVERAYARSDALERRRELMEQWADFCGGEK